MATIRAVCTDCGDAVNLQPADITLVVTQGQDTDPRPPVGSYGFNCPGCACYVVKPADERAIHLLIAGGVEPAELGGQPLTATRPERRPAHPEDPPDGGAPWTYDDLLDLHLKLEEDGWFEELLALTMPPGDPR